MRQLFLIGGIVFVLAVTGCPTLRGAKRCTQNARTCLVRDVNESAIRNAAGQTPALQSTRLGANSGIAVQPLGRRTPSHRVTGSQVPGGARNGRPRQT